jgi:hypothetical protein
MSKKEYDVPKVDEEQLTSIISAVGIFVAMPLLAIGFSGQAFIAVSQGGGSSILSLLAFAFGCGGLALSFSKANYGAQVGAGLIFVATILSFWLSYFIVFPENSHSTTMIITGCSVAVFFAVLDFIMRQCFTKDVCNSDNSTNE